MKPLKFKKIDAFATPLSSGNPAGCIYLENQDDLNGQQMQQIALELKGYVNEVGFISALDSNRFQLCFYSSERRVDFCGHAIVGIMVDLIRENPCLLNEKSITVITDKGETVVENRIRQEGCVFVAAPLPEYPLLVLEQDEMVRAMGLQYADILHDQPAQVLNAGLNTLIVPIRSLSAVLDMNPDQETLKKFCLESRIDIIIVFTQEVFFKENKIRSRVFAPVFGYLEDPATGSGNSALGYYLNDRGIWSGESISIEQNGMIEKCNLVRLVLKPDPSGKARVFFGGGAVTRISGHFYLNES